MNKCVYLRFRHKQGRLHYYCIKKRENVSKTCYMGCLEKEYKKSTPLKQKSARQKKIESERYSILQQDKSKCYFCNNKALDTHELIKGINRKKCIKWGLVVYICRDCHRKTEEDSEFYKETKKMAQEVWQNYYNKTTEEFIKEFGKNYL